MGYFLEAAASADNIVPLFNRAADLASTANLGQAADTDEENETVWSETDRLDLIAEQASLETRINNLIKNGDPFDAVILINKALINASNNSERDNALNAAYDAHEHLLNTRDFDAANLLNDVTTSFAENLTKTWNAEIDIQMQQSYDPSAPKPPSPNL